MRQRDRQTAVSGAGCKSFVNCQCVPITQKLFWPLRCPSRMGGGAWKCWGLRYNPDEAFDITSRYLADDRAVADGLVSFRVRRVLRPSVCTFNRNSSVYGIVELVRKNRLGAALTWPRIWKFARSSLLLECFMPAFYFRSTNGRNGVYNWWYVNKLWSVYGKEIHTNVHWQNFNNDNNNRIFCF